MCGTDHYANYPEIRARNCAPDNGYFVSLLREDTRSTRNIGRIIGLRSRKPVKDVTFPKGFRRWK